MLAKSKLNGIGTLISQTLNDMRISHKEYITILKEKDKYERMKDILKSENEKYMSNNTSCKANYKFMWLNSTCQGLKIIECIFKIASQLIKMESYCLKCKKNTENINPEVLSTRNGRVMILSKCAICSCKKSRFIKHQEAKGLLSK